MKWMVPICPFEIGGGEQALLGPVDKRVQSARQLQEPADVTRRATHTPKAVTYHVPTVM